MCKRIFFIRQIIFNEECMFKKHLLVPSRVRHIPKQFSFVDHRLVRDGHIYRLSHHGAALYLFLVTVSDHEGLSYYGEQSIRKRLHFGEDELSEARHNLVQTGLIAYEAPLYQVLGLDEATPAPLESRSKQGPLAVRDILRNIAREVS